MGLNEKKICFILTDSVLGGTERFVLKLLTRLVKTEAQLFVITLIGNRQLNRECDKIGVDNFFLNFNKLNFLFKTRTLRQAVKEFNPDLIHSFLFHANHFAGKLKNKKPEYKLIVSERGLDLRKSNWKIRMTGRYADRADLVTVVSEGVKAMIINREHVPESKIRFLGNGIDVSDYNIPESSSFRNEFNIPDAAVVWVNIARFRPEKGQIYLVKAFRNLLRSNPDQYLVLAGDGRERDRILDLCMNDQYLKKHVIFTGYREDIMNILTGCDIAVNSSLEEGFSAFNLEAILAGLPVLATEVGGNLDLISQGLAIPVKPASITDLEKKMEDIAEFPDQFKESGEQKKKKVLEEFSFGKVFDSLLRIYNEII